MLMASLPDDPVGRHDDPTVKSTTVKSEVKSLVESTRKSTEVDQSRDSRPTTRDLNRHVISLVAASWYDLGLELLDFEQAESLEIIKQDNKHDIVSCCRKMFSIWLETSDTATWGQIVDAAQRINLNDVVKAIEQLLTPVFPESDGEGELQHYDVYLSVSQDREDQEFAEDVYQKLQKENFTVFFSGHHNVDMIRKPLSESVEQMIREKCTKTLIILSDSYNKSEICMYEARMAHMKSLDARNHVLVPVMHKNCKIPDFISHLFYLDFEKYKDYSQEVLQDYFWNRLYRSLK